ncbi:hypothetical protein FQN55_000707 [Onygenales sp. PD_40]|nr:hypothetical protein FQN55_000707 [Onygenales sp. PD_40]KAK2789141.1 hypothetical protein FQN53_002365 [Emmonsiellopsis sp. PD_33]KAK2801786.1 hypothetical protein FQN51_005152 [Onygenales sp. PD_10]
MKLPFTYLVLALSAATSISAAPAPGTAAAAEPGVEATVNQLAARGNNFSKAACKTACDKGPDAVEKFCRLIPHAVVRGACWAAATAAQTPAGERTCLAFCDSWHKFEDWMEDLF